MVSGYPASTSILRDDELSTDPRFWGVTVVPAMPLLIAILFGGLVRVMLPGVASFSFSIRFSTRIEVLFFSDNRVLAFSGPSCPLGVLYLPGELLQLFQQVLVGDTERLHLVRVDLACLLEVGCPRRLADLHPWRIDVTPACVPS